MNHKYLFIVLLFCIGCAENKSSQSEDATQANIQTRRTPFDPMKSEAYKNILIMPEYKHDKDTIKNGDFLTARIFFNENIDMLKAVAAKENLSYEIEYDADAYTDNKSLMIMPSNDNNYADIKFQVPTNNEGEIQEHKWRYAITFKFLENEKNIYDTTFIRDVRYFVK